MIATTSSAHRRADITNALGLHLRPPPDSPNWCSGSPPRSRALLVAGPWPTARGPLSLICLAAGEGTTLELEAHGPDAEEAVERPRRSDLGPLPGNLGVSG